MKINHNAVGNFGVAMSKYKDSHESHTVSGDTYDNYFIDDGSFSVVLAKETPKPSVLTKIGDAVQPGTQASFYGMSIEVLGMAFVINDEFEVLVQLDELNDDGEPDVGVYVVDDENTIGFIEKYLSLRVDLLEKTSNNS